MNWPSSVSVRGIQMCWPKQCVIRLAIVVLPLPGAPYRNRPGAGVDRRAQQVEHLRLDADAAERGRQLLAPRRLGPNRLGLDRHDVVVERHRHRADVGAGLHRRAGPGQPLLGQRVAIVVELRLALCTSTCRERSASSMSSRMPNGRHSRWAMSRPLVEPTCSRYLQISVSITIGLMPVCSSDCGSAG